MKKEELIHGQIYWCSVSGHSWLLEFDKFNKDKPSRIITLTHIFGFKENGEAFRDAPSSYWGDWEGSVEENMRLATPEEYEAYRKRKPSIALRITQSSDYQLFN
jgi:hypothetical protein